MREFKEETGLDVKLDTLLSVEDSFFTSGTEDTSWNFNPLPCKKGGRRT